jgi:DNA-binding NarL/FixJ family response regulator
MPNQDQPAFPYNAHATPWKEADGIAWSENSTRDLIAALAQGDSVQEIANYLQYSVETVRAKMRELGLEEARR